MSKVAFAWKVLRDTQALAILTREKWGAKGRGRGSAYEVLASDQLMGCE